MKNRTNTIRHLITNTLKESLEPYLKQATEFWCAVALVNDAGYDYVQETIQENCIQSYLVGIDLPTTPSTLRRMQSQLSDNEFKAGIYKAATNYHPKVYLLKIADIIVGFIGSSNLTAGGLESNVELNYIVTNQDECQLILSWYEKLYTESYPLTNENLSEYEKQFATMNIEEQKNKLQRKTILLKKKSKFPLLDAIDFTDRFFKKEHHLSLRRELWGSDSESSIEERKSAKDRFIELDEIIFPQFRNYGLEILKPNPMPDHLISMIRQINPSKPKPIDAIWLSYGKNGNEIERYQKEVGKDQKAKQTFIHHARLQIRLDIKNIGIWLLFAKENDGGIFDRAYFRESMLRASYRDKFYDMIKSLPHDYFISVGGKYSFCRDFNSVQELHTFCKKDNREKYFYIGKNYLIADSKMSESNLPTETLDVFKILFPFYEFMRHRF